MSSTGCKGRRLRADVQRNREALLSAAQSRFLAHGVDVSLESVAKEASVGVGTLYRHFPTREALLAAVLQTRSEDLVARQAEIDQIGNAAEELKQWLRVMEESLSAFDGLPEPVMAAAGAQDPNNPLTRPCATLIAATDAYVRAAQAMRCVRPSVQSYDLFLAVLSIAWIKDHGANDEELLGRLRAAVTGGYREPGAGT